MKHWFEGLVNTARIECRYTRRHPQQWVICALLPVMWLLFVANTFGTGLMTKPPVGLVNEDGGPLARELVMVLDAVPSLGLRGFETATEAEAALSRAETYGTIVIPKGLHEGQPERTRQHARAHHQQKLLRRRHHSGSGREDGARRRHEERGHDQDDRRARRLAQGRVEQPAHRLARGLLPRQHRLQLQRLPAADAHSRPHRACRRTHLLGRARARVARRRCDAPSCGRKRLRVRRNPRQTPALVRLLRRARPVLGVRPHGRARLDGRRLRRRLDRRHGDAHRGHGRDRHPLHGRLAQLADRRLGAHLLCRAVLSVHGLFLSARVDDAGRRLLSGSSCRLRTTSPSRASAGS